MPPEWTYELVNDDGMAIRRDYTEDERGFVTLENEVTFVVQFLPDGETWFAPPPPCPCPACRKLIREGASMDRDQVARIASDIGSSLMPDNSQWMNRFTIGSTSSLRTYTVAQRRSDGVWGCSCPAWINRRHCKHLVDILERLAKLTEFDVTNPAVLDMLRSARTAYLDLDADDAYRVPSRFRTAQPTTRHIDL